MNRYRAREESRTGFWYVDSWSEPFVDWVQIGGPFQDEEHAEAAARGVHREYWEARGMADRKVCKVEVYRERGKA